MNKITHKVHDKLIEMNRIGFRMGFEYDDKILCNTEEEAIEVLKVLHKFGFYWHGGVSLLDKSEFKGEPMYYKVHSDFQVTRDTITKYRESISWGKDVVIGAEDFVERYKDFTQFSQLIEVPKRRKLFRKR